jgi:Zn-dependent protease with chaperone function
MGDLDFSHGDIERASRYHRPLYTVAAVRLALAVAVYSVLVWTWFGDRLWGVVDGLGWAGAAAAWAAIVIGVGTLARLPLDVWRGLVYERRWGFSTQSARGWMGDQAKGLALGLVLTAGTWVAAVALGRALPRWWWVPAAGGLALLTLLLSFIAPVVLEPLFNRFEPLADERLAADLRQLAVDAGVPVAEILVADASKRTTKSNAYVSGLGATRRVVLWDTLLRSAGEREVKLVIAHELGHRRERHAAKFTALFVLGGIVGVLVIDAALGAPGPRDLPLALLLLTGLELAGLPLLMAISRRWERVADRWSLDLTHDLGAFERTHVGLARDNLSDLAPPRLAYLLLFSHPTPTERLAYGRALAEA